MALFQKSSNERQIDLKREMKNFKFIHKNRNYGDVIVHNVEVSKLNVCDCDPNSAEPCSTNDCMNRMLNYECKRNNFF